MGPIGCPETSVRNYHYLLRNNPEERSYRISPKLPSDRTDNFHCMSLRQGIVKQSSLVEVAGVKVEHSTPDWETGRLRQ